MKLIMPEAVKAIIDTLEQSGYEAYAVGGCVRDSVMGKEPSDWDICTSALPEETLTVLHADNIIQNGLKHGTVTVRVEGQNYEITTFRTDGIYRDNRHPESVQFVRSLHEDLARRDFTINALAYSPEKGLQDDFGGLSDMANKVLRCVGEPDKRFGEDALRILRALRFASVLGFSIEPVTAESIHRNAALLHHISAERIFSELVKLLQGGHAEQVLLAYPDVLGVFMPEILPMAGLAQHNPYHCYDVWTHTVKAVAAIRPTKILRLAALFHDIGKPQCHRRDERGIDHFHGHPDVSEGMAEQILKRLKCDKKTISNVCRLIKMHDVRVPAQRKNVRKMIAKTGMERFPDLLELKRADAKAQSPQHLQETLDYVDALEAVYREEAAKDNDFTLRTLAVNGRDLQALGMTDGKRIGQCLNRLLEKVIDCELENQKERLLSEVVSWNIISI